MNHDHPPENRSIGKKPITEADILSEEHERQIARFIERRRWIAWARWASSNYEAMKKAAREKRAAKRAAKAQARETPEEKAAREANEARMKAVEAEARGRRAVYRSELKERKRQKELASRLIDLAAHRAMRQRKTGQ